MGCLCRLLIAGAGGSLDLGLERRQLVLQPKPEHIRLFELGLAPEQHQHTRPPDLTQIGERPGGFEHGPAALGHGQQAVTVDCGRDRGRRARAGHQPPAAGTVRQQLGDAVLDAGAPQPEALIAVEGKPHQADLDHERGEIGIATAGIAVPVIRSSHIRNLDQDQ